MAKARPVEQFISQTQPFLRQGPKHLLTLKPQWATYKAGDVGKTTINASMNMKIDYLDGKKNQNKKNNTHSEVFKMVHCKLQCTIRGKKKKKEKKQWLNQLEIQIERFR